MCKILLIWLLLPISILAQKVYPIQTILKGDSVVIYTVEQNDDIELLLANQRNRVNYYKNSIAEQERIIDSLKNALCEKEEDVDSLRDVVRYKFANYDSLEEKYRNVEKWLYNTAVDHGYLYYSYSDSTIMSIDLGSYILVGYKRSGNFSLARRGPTSQDLKWKEHNRNVQEEPNYDWLTYYKEKWRPVLIKFPYKIEMQP